MLVLVGCSSGPKVRPFAEPKSGAKLFVEAQYEDGAFSADTLTLIVFEELSDCRRKYLGETRLKNGKTTEFLLPVDKELLLSLGRTSANPFLGHSSVKNFWIRVIVKGTLQYKAIFKERNGSKSSDFQARNRSGGAWGSLPSLPDRECNDLKVIWE